MNKRKLELVNNLFRHKLTDNKGNLIDDEKVISIKSLIPYSRAYYISVHSITEVTKDDLRYINKVCKKLIDILGYKVGIKDGYIFESNCLNDIAYIESRVGGFNYQAEISLWIPYYNELVDIYCKNNHIL